MTTNRFHHCQTARSLGVTLTLFTTLLLGACGGGGGSSSGSAFTPAPTEPVPPPDPTPTTQTLEGTAAIGAPIIDGVITAKCADGSGFTQAVATGSDGRWSGTIASDALPCALQVSAGTPPVTLHSYASAPGTVNITPLTDLTLALATTQSPQDWFDNFDGSSVDTGAAAGTLLDSLAAKDFDIPVQGNPFTTPFDTNSTGWDGLLDDIGESVADDPTLPDYAALVALVKDGQLDSLPSAPVPVTYSITGTITGASGTVQWQVGRNGSTYNSGSTGNGAVVFTLPVGMPQNSAWNVVVATPPAGQTCTVANGSGTLTADVTNIAIQCSDTVIPPVSFSITGSITGASGPVAWQTLLNNGPYHSGSNGNGGVTFTTPAGMAQGSAWRVQVITPPAGQTCAVSNGSGTLAANLSDVLISCKDNVVVVPGDAPYDFSTLNLRPVVPGNLAPIAPAVTPIDPGLDIADLYAQLGERELAKIFAPAPANLTRTFETSQNTYSIFEQDANSSWLRQLSINPGADNEVNTADDTIIAYTIYPEGQNHVRYSYTNPGPDAIWFTADDVAGRHTGQPAYFPSGVVLEYEDASEGVILILPFLDPGADARFFSADDSVNFGTGYQIAILDGEGNRGQIVTYDRAGDDGQWFTADDRVKNYMMVTSALTGRQVISALYGASGTDSTWFTGDDVVTQHTQTQLDSNYIVRYSAVYDARGTDNGWFTADDRVLSWTYYGYDADGNPILVATHTNKGNDGIWFTADDTARGLVSLKDANGYPVIDAIIAGSGAMGPDGVWLSGDETLSGYAYTGFDEWGNRILNAQIQSAGADGKWFTGDDLPTASYNYWKWEYDAQRRITQQIYYDPALAPASPAFSDAQVSEYTVYNPDFSTSVTVYRDANGSTFGGDGAPFTADDFTPWPYTVETQAGYDQFNQPGPDGTWFTGDDVKSGYVLRQFDGKRKTLEQFFDAQDRVVSYSEIVDQTADSYRTNHYQVDESGTATLTGYNEVDEGGQGYPLWITWYSVAGDITNIDYTEYDNKGNITRQSSAYSPGKDGIWATQDDFGYYSLQYFNSDNELIIQASDYPGPDRDWGTGDDYWNLDRIVALDYDAGELPGNTGYLAKRCDELMSPASGSINVVVRDQNGNPLPGAIAQLNSQGSTSTTDANGVATFAGLNGTQDLHLFKDGYGWESFYCVAPGPQVTIEARLNSLTQLAFDSKVNFIASPANERFLVRLLDAQGNSIATRSHSTSTGGEYGTTYGDLHFALPEGSEVSGDLWAFQVDNNGKLTSAESLGNRTYTTIAGSLYSDYNEIDLAFTAAPPVPVATYGTLVAPGYRYAELSVSLGGLFNLPFAYEPSLSGSFATVPDTNDVTLPDNAQPTALAVTGEFWEAWYPGDFPRLGEGSFRASVVTGFQYEALIQNQDAPGDQPVIQWSPARQVSEGAFTTLTTLELRSAAGGLGYQPHWTIHVPAGNSSVELPLLPAGLSSALLPQSTYKMVIRARAVPELDYHTLIGTQDLHKLSRAYATEALTTGSDFDEGNTLKR